MLVLAATHAELLGITSVSGNVGIALTTRNALAVAQVFAIDAPVHRGAARPLLEPPRHAEPAHGKSGLDGPVLPRLVRTEEPTGAVQFIVETVRAVDHVWLVAVGPLTNIALALRAAPDLAGRLAGISIMGGSATVGNVTAAAEFNIWADPEAAAAVFDSGVPLMMAGLNLTNQLQVDARFAERLRATGSERGSFAAAMVSFYAAAVGRRTGRTSGALHDPCAVVALTRPDLVRYEPRHVVVETAGTHTRGMTLVDERAHGGAVPNALVGYEIDAPAVLDLLVDAVGRG